MESYSNELFTFFPHAPFFLKHVVMINYAGKTYCILKGLEVAVESESILEQGLFVTYSICMILGQYWYTKFWLHKKDIENYYYNEKQHILARFSNFWVTLLAAMYYLCFSIMFAWDYSENKTSAAFSFAVWNVWCCFNLLLATPCFKN